MREGGFAIMAFGAFGLEHLVSASYLELKAGEFSVTRQESGCQDQSCCRDFAETGSE